ncbi:MAG: hypothetical protein M1825_002166 [Sarcosagium campestre]|nr:MAG: hypothetical protein M1825_002166 [Sarcosagium campestre]
MPRTDEAENFFAAVYQAIQEIPYGQVTSYGHIAHLIGRPECPRQVGVCLKHLLTPEAAAAADAIYHSESVPWQRVINSRGTISQRGHASGASLQAAALRSEGVEVGRNNTGELTVDFGVYGWFPSVLPSEADDDG